VLVGLSSLSLMLTCFSSCFLRIFLCSVWSRVDTHVRLALSEFVPVTMGLSSDHEHICSSAIPSDNAAAYGQAVSCRQFLFYSYFCCSHKQKSIQTLSTSALVILISIKSVSNLNDCSLWTRLHALPLSHLPSRRELLLRTFDIKYILFT
jgi:hypothetical protein